MPLPLVKIGLAAAAGYYFYNRYRKSRGIGSQTNASDAVDDIPLGANPSHDEMIDAGVQETFPASDPIAVGKGETAYEKQQRQG
jgi:hypothetical protein